MHIVTEMSREIFQNNLISAVEEIVNTKCIDKKVMAFKIVPVYEANKPLNGRDNQMRLIALSEKNIGSRLLSVEEATNLLSCQSPFVPIWINVSFECIDGEKAIFKLETSLRFRKPSLLRNAETGHAPFKAIV